MKKTMWIISIIPLIITLAVLQFMPSSIPVHYNMAGEIDRWGSKYESLILPVIILLTTFFWHMFISYFEKKAVKSKTDKGRAEALLNSKVLKITATVTLIYAYKVCKDEIAL